MSRRVRSLKRSIFIACEGQTEERYFNAIGEIINEDPKYSVKVRTLEIEDGVPQDPIGLVKEAAKIRDDEGHDEAWAVFDKDREPNHQVRIQAFQIAAAKRIGVAYSSVAFEHWVLLHFEKNSTSFQRCDCTTGPTGICNCNGQDCVTSYLRSAHFADYRKASYKLYSRLSAMNQHAVENSAWLKFQNRANLSHTLEILTPYQLNPHTDVDLLLSRLLDMKRVIFTAMNITQISGGKSFTMLSVQGNSLSARITNHTGIAYPVNNQGGFRIKDNEGQLHPTTIANAVVVVPNQTIDVVFTFETPPNRTAIEFRVVEDNNILICPF